MRQTKKLICILLALLLGIGTAIPVLAAFPDVDDSADYAEAVEYLSDIGIFSGDDRGNFNPDNAVTRAEMAVLLCKMLGETEDLTRSDTFTDVPREHWANPYVTHASELGFVSGYGDGTFGPGNSVTYEQAVTMLVRAIGLEDEAIALGGYPDGYIAVAEQYRITKDIDATQGYGLSRKNVAIMLYNAIL